MTQTSVEVAASLERVGQVRRTMERDAGVAARVLAVKRYQHERFKLDYAQLLASARYGQAARFFLEDLYGPVDYAARDAEFGRVLPAMSRLLPQDVLCTVGELIELHALSEELDLQMALALASDVVDERSYRAAWRTVGRRDARERQLALLLRIGGALDRHARTMMLAATLRLMRAPARAAGLSRLQSFLERGFAAFASMRGAADFLGAIAANEQAVAEALFRPE